MKRILLLLFAFCSMKCNKVAKKGMLHTTAYKEEKKEWKVRTKRKNKKKPEYSIQNSSDQKIQVSNLDSAKSSNCEQKLNKGKKKGLVPQSHNNIASASNSPTKPPIKNKPTNISNKKKGDTSPLQNNHPTYHSTGAKRPEHKSAPQPLLKLPRTTNNTANTNNNNPYINPLIPYYQTLSVTPPTNTQIPRNNNSIQPSVYSDSNMNVTLINQGTIPNNPIMPRSNQPNSYLVPIYTQALQNPSNPVNNPNLPIQRSGQNQASGNQQDEIRDLKDELAGMRQDISEITYGLHNENEGIIPSVHQLYGCTTTAHNRLDILEENSAFYTRKNARSSHASHRRIDNIEINLEKNNYRTQNIETQNDQLKKQIQDQNKLIAEQQKKQDDMLQQIELLKKFYLARKDEALMDIQEDQDLNEENEELKKDEEEQQIETPQNIEIAPLEPIKHYNSLPCSFDDQNTETETDNESDDIYYDESIVAGTPNPISIYSYSDNNTSTDALSVELVDSSSSTSIKKKPKNKIRSKRKQEKTQEFHRKKYPKKSHLSFGKPKSLTKSKSCSNID